MTDGAFAANAELAVLQEGSLGRALSSRLTEIGPNDGGELLARCRGEISHGREEDDLCGP